MTPHARDRLAIVAILLALLVPAWPLLTSPGSVLADPLSELPVRLWVHETFLRVGVFGGQVDTASFPNLGPLNNPDPLGTVVTAALRPLLGRPGAFDALVLGQLAATCLAMWLLARDVVGDGGAAVIAAIGFGLTPLALVYGVDGAVVDVLALWPYPLCARALLRAARRPGWRDAVAAGAWAGVGFVTCPYDVLVFEAVALPAFLWLLYTRGDALSVTEDPPRPSLRRWLVVGAFAVAGGLAVAGPYALRMRGLMADPTSQMSDAAIAGTRHAWPYPLLLPAHTHRYVAYLSDYLAVGKGALIERVAASRFYRAFSPGYTLLALAIAGAVLSERRRAVGLWLFVAAFAAVASTGPYLPVTASISLPTPGNPAWGALRLLPGTALLLEPFRYGLAASFGLAVAAAIGARELARRHGGWVLVAAPIVWVVELVVVSPVPFPLATAKLDIPAVYSELDRLLGPGAIIELPYFDRGTDRFIRSHFLFELVHGRPIADEVLGFPPRYLVENQFTAALLATEKPHGGPLQVTVTDATRIDADRGRLAADGFAGIVVDPSLYPTERARIDADALLLPLGRPVEVGGRRVYRLAR